MKSIRNEAAIEIAVVCDSLAAFPKIPITAVAFNFYLTAEFDFGLISKPSQLWELHRQASQLLEFNG